MDASAKTPFWYHVARKGGGGRPVVFAAYLCGCYGDNDVCLQALFYLTSTLPSKLEKKSEFDRMYSGLWRLNSTSGTLGVVVVVSTESSISSCQPQLQSAHTNIALGMASTRQVAGSVIFSRAVWYMSVRKHSPYYYCP